MEIASNLGIQPGQVLENKYRIDRVLGQGGMGVVVQATHLVLEERVAIKFLLPTMSSNPEVVERFVREAKAAIKIRSEHISRVMDVSAANSAMPYLVMEYLEGKDLSHVLEEGGPLPPRDVVGYMLQACEALGEAHAQGIVHRDLKPANLFLTKRADGTASVKVLDFGISKLGIGGQDSSLTRTQGMMGSPLYMSPEQAKSARESTVRSDIWSLGVMMYELLTGDTPFRGESLMELCVDLYERHPPAPSSVRPGLPTGLDGVVMKCIAKDPAHRFQNVAELALALAPFGGGSAWESARVTARVLGVDPMAAAERIVAMSPEPMPEPLQGPVGQPVQQAAQGQSYPQQAPPAQGQSCPQQPAALSPTGETVGSWGTTRTGKKSSRATWAVLAVLAVLVAAVLVFVAGGAGMLWWQSSTPPAASVATEGSAVTGASSPASVDSREEVEPAAPFEDEVPPSAASSAAPVADAPPSVPPPPPAKTKVTLPPKPPVKPPVGKKSDDSKSDLDLFMDNK